LNLDQVLAPIVHEFETVAKERGLKFESDLGKHRVHSDQIALSRIVRNILSNAMNYTPRGGRVKLQTASDGGSTRISISDTGPGIPEEEQNRVFEEKVRLDSGRHRAGNGLGLHISRQLADMIGSELTLNSQLGVGTEIVITLENSSTVRSKHLRSVLVVGPARHKIYGEWVPLLSSWKMPGMVAADLAEALTMIQVLQDAPEILVLGEASVPSTAEDLKAVDELLDTFIEPPLIYIDAASELAASVCDTLRSRGYTVKTRPKDMSSSALRTTLRSTLEDTDLSAHVPDNQ